MQRIMTAALAAALLGSMARADKPTDMLVKAPSRYAKLDKLGVHYKSFGEGKTTVVFIHGAFCDLTTWRFQVPAFADKGRVVLIDLPGHGQSDKPKIDYNMDLFARAADAVLKEAGVEKAVLVGHSMGTSVARQFWRLYPEKTTALVAVDGMIAALPFATPAAVKALDRKKVKETLLQFAVMAFGKDTPAEVRQAMKAVIVKTPDYVVESTMKGLADPSSPPPWSDSLSRLPPRAAERGRRRGRQPGHLPGSCSESHLSSQVRLAGQLAPWRRASDLPKTAVAVIAYDHRRLAACQPGLTAGVT